jgi:hypothetical protein
MGERFYQGTVQGRTRIGMCAGPFSLSSLDRARQHRTRPTPDRPNTEGSKDISNKISLTRVPAIV